MKISWLMQFAQETDQTLIDQLGFSEVNVAEFREVYSKFREVYVKFNQAPNGSSCFTGPGQLFAASAASAASAACEDSVANAARSLIVLTGGK